MRAFLSQYTRPILAVLLAAHAGLALATARRSSPTVDEVNHLPAGVSYWQQGTFALYHHNPPLVKLLAALPVLASGAKADYSGSWADAQRGRYPPNQAAFGTEFMRANANRYFTLYFRARCVIAAISVLGGLVVFSWGREFFGTAAALCAAALWCFSPNILAHAGVVTTDLPLTVAGLAATYMFWRWLHKPALARAVPAGLLLGMAQLVKFSALALYVVWPIAGALYIVLARRGEQPPANPQHTARTAAAHGAIMLALSLITINVGYAFEGTGRSLGSFPFLSTPLTRTRTGGQSAYPNHPPGLLRLLYSARQNRFEGTWLARLPVPLPAHYVLGFDQQSFDANPNLERELPEATGYPVYLRGQLRSIKDPQTGRVGWWWYYLYALAVKVPLSTWVLTAAALIAAISRRRLPLRDECVLVLPPLITLAAMSLLTDINIGLRYVLPLLPFVFLFAARLAAASLQAPGDGPAAITHRRPLLSRCNSLLIAACLGWNIITAVLTYPHYLSYFNRLAGGPSGGHRHLIDSNLDWGQDLPQLKRWLAEHRITQPIRLAYFGSMDPSVAGIAFRLPPADANYVRPNDPIPHDPAGLTPGIYAVSVNYVMGLPFPRCFDGDGNLVRIPYAAYRYFQSITPTARAGYSIWIYDLDDNDVQRLKSRISNPNDRMPFSTP